MNVYVVTIGESSEGGFVKAVRSSLESAKRFALSQRPLSGEWVEAADPAKHGAEAVWYAGCEWMAVEAWEVDA